MQLFDRLADLADRRSVLRHPFYERWTAGVLTLDELALYAGQYRHAVVALAHAADAAAKAADEPTLHAELEAHAAEEASHIALWDEFLDSVGGDHAAPAAPETEACVVAWSGGAKRTLAENLAALYAIESAQPEIARVKREGLERHYGIETAMYFSLHETLDNDHAAAVRAALEPRVNGSADQLVAEADRVLRGNWLLLDGVERACGR